jgi:hypothetical protein
MALDSANGFGANAMDFAKRFHRGAYLKGAVAAASLLLIAAAAASIYQQNRPLPEESAEAVVEKFYERISQAKIRGGTLLIRDAFKLVDAERSRLSETRFVQVVEKYPPGFRVNVVDSEIVERHAKVTVEYELSSMFGDSFTVRNVIPLNVDEETNTWKIDFTGETDSLDLAAARASQQ